MHIERPTAHTSNVSELFGGKVFKVPDYQRAYAWGEKNIEEFWNDIKDGLETDTPHYWGTITLRNTGQTLYDENSASSFTIYEVVDGQQRLTTLYLILFAFYKLGKSAIKSNFLKCNDFYRLELGTLNQQFLKELIDDTDHSPELSSISSNKLIKKTYEYFENQIKTYENIDRLVRYTQSLTFSLEFEIKDEGLAIKAFESLNDRGKPLTLLDKSKSFLIFYSARFLGGSLNQVINNIFGNVFKNIDIIKDIAFEAKIEYIKNPRYRFSEDELFRFFYHYFAKYSIDKYVLNSLNYDYTITTENVFDQWLKKSCIALKNLNGQSDRLSEFISDMLNNFNKFVDNFKKLIEDSKSDSSVRKLFCFLGMNAAVYPLIISLKSENIIDKEFLELIETSDLRVYKVRGTDPRSELYKEAISNVKVNPHKELILSKVYKFAENFMKNAEFQLYLSGNMYGNPATKYILWEYQKICDPSFNEWDYDLFKNVQVEHIFPKEPTISFPGSGFEDEADYLKYLNILGNLTLLEEDINKSIGNTAPINKAKPYQGSKIPVTKKLGDRKSVV